MANQSTQKPFSMNLSEVQPSQLFIHTDKLDTVLNDFTRNQFENEIIFPVIGIGEKIIYTDGHTRAYAAYLHGIRQIQVYWDTDDLDHEMYAECVRWCEETNITNISHLQRCIVSEEDYQKYWLGRCRVMQEEVLTKRKQNA